MERDGGPIDPRDAEPERFLAWARTLGVQDIAVRRFLAAYIGQGVDDPKRWGSEFGVPKRLTDALPPRPRLSLETSRTSASDNFQKLLFRTGDGLAIETVLIPLEKPGAVSLCLSSQVGCAMGCAFCATARMPSRRNLATWEILDQWMQARDIAKSQGRRVTGTVFMGMGEPFLNYDRVLDAAELLRCSYGGAIAGKAITISTVGVVPQIDRYTEERRRFRLSISLGAATDEKRRELVPVAARWPIREVFEAARRYQQVWGGRVMLSYVCIGGVNMGPDDAEALGELVGDLPIRFDLIEVTDPTGRFRRPTLDELNDFRDALTRSLRQPIVRRYSGGADIDAACGTLAGVG